MLNRRVDWKLDQLALRPQNDHLLYVTVGSLHRNNFGHFWRQSQQMADPGRPSSELSIHRYGTLECSGLSIRSGTYRAL